MIRIDNYYYVFKKYDLRHNEIKEEYDGHSKYELSKYYDVLNPFWKEYEDHYGCYSFGDTKVERWYEIFKFFGYIDNEENYKYWVYNYIDGHPIMNSYRIYRKFKSEEGRELFFKKKEMHKIYSKHWKRESKIWHIKSEIKREKEMKMEEERFDEEFKMYKEIDEDPDEYYYNIDDGFDIFIESVDNQVHKVDYIYIYKGEVAQVLVIHCYNGNNIEFHKTETGFYTNTYVYQGIQKPGIEEWKLITAFEPLELDEL